MRVPSLLVSLFLALAPLRARAAKASLPDPAFVTYWGQSSSEKTLKEYCATGYFNVISIGFVYQFGDNPIAFQTDGCDGTQSSSAACTSLASQISSCQADGVKVLVSLGGGTVYDCGDSGCTGNYTFATTAEATSTARTLWQMFFNSGKTTSDVWRPFGSVVVDGIDLDIEMVSRYNSQNPQLHYDTLINTLLSYDSDIIIGAAPECQYGSLGEAPLAGVVTEAPIDFLFVQVFNNAKCSFTSSDYDAMMAHWAGVATANPNGDTRLLLGLPGDTASALLPSYFVTSAEALASVASLRSLYPGAHVGMGVWDAASSIGSTQSGSEANWAKNVAAGLAALPAAASSSSGAASGTVATTSSLAAIVGNSTLSTSPNNAATPAKTSSTSFVSTSSTSSSSTPSATKTGMAATVLERATAQVALLAAVLVATSLL